MRNEIRKEKTLTVKDRMEEKNVPSSYRESLDNTPSKTAANCESKSMFAWQAPTPLAWVTITNLGQSNIHWQGTTGWKNRKGFLKNAHSLRSDVLSHSEGQLKRMGKSQISLLWNVTAQTMPDGSTFETKEEIISLKASSIRTSIFEWYCCCRTQGGDGEEKHQQIWR